jgi:hypothetical protein
MGAGSVPPPPPRRFLIPVQHGNHRTPHIHAFGIPPNSFAESYDMAGEREAPSCALNSGRTGCTDPSYRDRLARNAAVGRAFEVIAAPIIGAIHLLYFEPTLCSLRLMTITLAAGISALLLPRRADPHDAWRLLHNPLRRRPPPPLTGHTAPGRCTRRFCRGNEAAAKRRAPILSQLGFRVG